MISPFKISIFFYRMNTPIDYSCVVVVDDGCDGGGCGGEDEDVAVDAVVLY